MRRRGREQLLLVAGWFTNMSHNDKTLLTLGSRLAYISKYHEWFLSIFLGVQDQFCRTHAHTVLCFHLFSFLFCFISFYRPRPRPRPRLLPPLPLPLFLPRIRPAHNIPDISPTQPQRGASTLKRPHARISSAHHRHLLVSYLLRSFPL